MSSEPPRELTWGEEMALAAQRLAGRRMPQQRWSGQLSEIFDRVAATTQSAANRFRRVEVESLAPTLLPASDEGGKASASEGFQIPPAVRDRLRATLGGDISTVRVHTDKSAAALAQRENAAALTVGQHIYFGERQFQPHDPRGFALLAHEAFHALESTLPGAAFRRAISDGAQAEERRALSLEQYLRLPGAPPAQPQMGGSPRVLTTSRALDQSPLVPLALAPNAPRKIALAPNAPNKSSFVPNTPPARPMAADSARPPFSAPATEGGADIDDLKRSIYADLMRQIRTDFERGG